jgi:hypothetical protein
MKGTGVTLTDKKGRPTPGAGKIAFASERSQNQKLGGVSTTYAAQVSCPDTCVFRNNGCYAESSGPIGWMTTRMNTAAAEAAATIMDVANAEAESIRGLTGKRDLRLHTLGDCKTNESARTVAGAAMEHMAKFGRRAWTYTHGWMAVLRESWLGVSVLASCETVKQVRLAHARGYAAAIVVQEHPEDGKAYKSEEYTIIPCPEQTGRAASCAECRLCWDDQKLHARKAVIAFATHGGREGAANGALDRVYALVREAQEVA